MSKPTTTTKQIQIKLIKSGIGFPEKQKKVIKGLGFRKLNHVITRSDTPEIRGMVFKIRHLVEIVEG
jgi:large subunit ribosomal protein L30